MSEIINPNPVLPASKVAPKKRVRISYVWLIPAVAALAGIWIAVTTIRNQGPTITINFRSAEGLQAGKTKIRYNGVEVGEISDIRLSPEHQTVIVTAKMSPQTEEFLHEDTQFWVVRPEISGASISGLSTIISGAYVGMEIGKAKVLTRHFTALAAPPPDRGGITGKYFILKTPSLGSLNKGTPVYFRQLRAGQVESYELDQGGDALNVKIFVQSPYDKFVTDDTRFWQASGVDVSLSASGMRVQTESLLSILIGGIAFETPTADLPQSPAREETSFQLAKDRTDAFRPPAQDPQSYTLVFTESLRGLTVGAPVELDGIPVGEVTAIHAQFDARTDAFSAPVTVEIDPARFGVDFLSADHPGAGTNVDSAASHRQRLEVMVARGLRAQLKTGSLISGSRYVALDFFPDAPPVTLDWSQKPLQFPTLPGSMESIVSGVASVIKKFDQLPLNEIGTNLQTTISNLNQTLAGVQGTLTNTDQLLKNAGQFIAPDSAFDAQLTQMLQQAGGAAQAIRVLADYLERHPEALIHGKTGEPK